MFRGPHRICTLAKDGWVDIRGRRSSEGTVGSIELVRGAGGVGRHGHSAGRRQALAIMDLQGNLDGSTDKSSFSQGAYRTGIFHKDLTWKRLRAKERRARACKGRTEVIFRNIANLGSLSTDNQ